MKDLSDCDESELALVFRSVPVHKLTEHVS